jgi:acyl carrier protein
VLTTTKMKIRRQIARELLEGRAESRDPLRDGALDSLAVEQLVTYIEDEFRIRFEDHELVAENFADIPTLAMLVESKRKEPRGAAKPEAPAAVRREPQADYSP